MVLTKGGHPPRATVPRNGGLQPQDWRATNPRTGRRIFLQCRLPRVLPRLRRIRVRHCALQWFSRTCSGSSQCTCLTLRRRVPFPGPAVWTPFRLPCGCRKNARLTCIAHVLEETGVSCEGQLSVSVLRVQFSPGVKSRRVVLSLWVQGPELPNRTTKQRKRKVSERLRTTDPT